MSAALEEAARSAAPATLLARVQGCWAEVAGEVVAQEATPLREHRGTLTVGCRSAVWAQELELLAPDLVGRLNEALGGDGEGPIKGLRARVEGRT